MLTKIITRLRWHWWNLYHKSRPVHWLLQPCGSHGQILIRSNSLLGRAIYCRSFEVAEEKFIRRTLGPGMTVFDVGAHIGWHTILLAQTVNKGGVIHVFEPSPTTFKHLHLNIELNNLSHQVEAHNLALSDQSKEIGFFIFPEGHEVYNSIGARKRSESMVAGHQINVTAETLDDFCRSRNVNKIDFIKIDVEGAEELVLRGGQQMLQANPHLVMMIELYEPSAQQCGCSVKNTLAMLKNLEFFPHRLDDQGNILPLSSGAQQELIQGANKDYNFIFKRLGI